MKAFLYWENVLSAIPNTLLLNASFEPLRVVHWQRAFGLLFQDKVEVLEEYGLVVHSVSRVFRIPAVIRLKRWINLKHLTPSVRFCRTNVYIRDSYCCQYCGGHFPEKDLTLDHVKPVVRGGKKSWENIVTACKRCNQRKGDSTPEEAGLTLLKPPQKPHWLPGKLGLDPRGEMPKMWEPYLTERLRVVA